MSPLHSLRRTAAATTNTSSASTALGFKWVRDRGLDHAVEREKHLIPLLNTKNLLISEPSKSLPISSISDLRASLLLPSRPIDFLRRYPTFFRESLPAGIPAARPHFALTDAALDLHSDEQLLLSSDSHRRDAATRLLRLLMLRRTNSLPLSALHRLRFDLGLPEDFHQTLVPEFPDFFRLRRDPSGTPSLELVCWIDEFANPTLEKKNQKDGSVRFPTSYSRGFEAEKKYKKWVEDWQKLPYFSPYEDWSRLPPKSDESDRWAAAVLHEFLHILAPKKTEKENVLLLGECLGIHGRIKRAMFQHPGIFYISSRNDTYTVVLREGYHRGVLVEDHPLMGLRSKYIHLMSSVREESKTVVSVPTGGEKKEGIPEGKVEIVEEDEAEVSDSSDVESSDRRTRRRRKGTGLEGKRGKRKHTGKSIERVPRKFSLGTEKQDRRVIGRSSFTKGKISS